MFIAVTLSRRHVAVINGVKPCESGRLTKFALADPLSLLEFKKARVSCSEERMALD